MKSGFTTGSCAAAASKAATYMLLSGRIKNRISIITPAGVEYEPYVTEIDRQDDYVSCGIVKDAGDDPDITDGILVCAKVSVLSNKENTCRVELTGGIGVGKVTRPGLEMPVGEWAINSTPRKMVENEVLQVANIFDFKGVLQVEIFVPQGEEIAKKTFNPHMGIEGGISILGTTGIVEPMSNEALIKTIDLDLAQKKAEGMDVAILVPGNYGETFLKNNYNVSEKDIIHFSNFVGIGIDLAVKHGFDKILVVGHTGKLIKVSGGIMNTHSKEADSRLELMAAATIEAATKNNRNIEINLISEILSQITTTGALEILAREGLLEPTCEKILEKIVYHLQKRAGNNVKVECILYENSFGLLAKTDGAEELL